MYDHILVPVDLSDIEKGKACLAIARQIGGAKARIHLLNVVEEIPGYVAVELPADLLQNAVRNAEKALTGMAEAEGGACEAEVIVGNTNRTIVETADKLAADLIVIGSHRPGLQDYLLGSAAGWVVRHCNRSILVVRGV